MNASATKPPVNMAAYFGRFGLLQSKGDFKVIVAIDFGTHGTGIGYAILDQDQKEPETYIEQDWYALCTLYKLPN